MPASKSAGRGRRAEYAAETRRAIGTAARRLFVTKGFFATTVDDIAVAARVASATVYAVAGGKEGLLKAIIEGRASAPDVAETYARILAMTDPDELLRFIVAETRTRFENSRDLMRVIDTAPHDPAAAEALQAAHASLGGGLARTAHRLAELWAQPAGVSEQAATDTLWFYLYNAAYFTMTDDLGWPLDQAEEWLCESLRTALRQR